MPLVEEKTFTMVFSCHSVPLEGLSTPPHKSKTVSPSISKLIAAPNSKPVLILLLNTSLASENFSSQYPFTIIPPKVSYFLF